MTDPRFSEILKVSKFLMIPRRGATTVSFCWLIMRIAIFDSLLFHMKNVLATAQGFLGRSAFSIQFQHWLVDVVRPMQKKKHASSLMGNANCISHQATPNLF
jgi:hypothetical protein